MTLPRIYGQILIYVLPTFKTLLNNKPWHALRGQHIQVILWDIDGCCKFNFICDPADVTLNNMVDNQ